MFKPGVKIQTSEHKKNKHTISPFACTDSSEGHCWFKSPPDPLISTENKRVWKVGNGWTWRGGRGLLRGPLGAKAGLQDGVWKGGRGSKGNRGLRVALVSTHSSDTWGRWVLPQAFSFLLWTERRWRETGKKRKNDMKKKRKEVEGWEGGRKRDKDKEEIRNTECKKVVHHHHQQQQRQQSKLLKATERRRCVSESRTERLKLQHFVFK